MGIAPLEATEVYIVQDGKIISGEWTPTAETIAKLEAAMAPPATMPESGGERFPIYTLIMAMGGLLLLGGIGLTVWRYRSA